MFELRHSSEVLALYILSLMMDVAVHLSLVLQPNTIDVAQENAELTMNRNVDDSPTHVSDVEIDSLGTCLPAGGGRCSRLGSLGGGLQADLARSPRTDGGGGEL